MRHLYGHTNVLAKVLYPQQQISWRSYQQLLCQFQISNDCSKMLCNYPNNHFFKCLFSIVFELTLTTALFNPSLKWFVSQCFLLLGRSSC